MSDYEFDAPETMEGGDALDAEGHFLFLVHEIRDGETHKGTTITGFSTVLEVLDGEEKIDGICPHKGRVFRPIIWAPKLSDDREKQERTKRAQTAFFIATNVIGPAQLDTIRAIAAARASGQTPPKMKLNLQAGVNQMIVMNVRRWKKEGEEGKGDLTPHFSDIYHVDDPRAKVVAIDPAVLAFVPPELRRKPEELQAIKDAFSGKSSGKPAPPPPPPSNGDDELDGL